MGWNFQDVIAFFYLLNSCISSQKIFSIVYAFFTILRLHTLSFREVLCHMRAFFGWIVELLFPKNSVHISSCLNFLLVYAVLRLSDQSLVCGYHMCAFWGWIVELQILKTSVHFSSYPNFKMMYAFRKMFVSCSIRFWGEIFKKWSLFLPVE